MRERGSWRLGSLSDGELVEALKGAVAAGFRIEARVVAHLAELDARKLHLRAAQSLWKYCRAELGFSENQAFSRITAAKVSRRFPLVLELLASNELHLTTITLISKYLTRENHVELCAAVRGKSKRQVLRLLAQRWPRPLEPHEARKLIPGQTSYGAGPTGSVEPMSEDIYRLALNVRKEVCDKLELARDLMSHQNPSGDLGVILERALDQLIESLQKSRFGQTKRPRTTSPRPQPEAATHFGRPKSRDSIPTHLGQPKSYDHHAAAHLGQPTSQDQPTRPRHAGSSAPLGDVRGAPAHPTSDHGDQATPHAGNSSHTALAEGPSRKHIPHELRRQIVARDGLCCSFRDTQGKRCEERAFLQIHHEEPWARGGPDTLKNLRLLCAAHNQWLAEQVFCARHVRAATQRKKAS